MATDPHAAQLLVSRLARAGQTLCVAESCTGGLLGGAITSVPGSSEVFWGGVISYDDGAKTRLLSVPRETLVRCGAVSREVAEAMARGVRAISGSTWGLSVTGIAGPDGGTEEKPVGTVWIAVAGPSPAARRHHFCGDREHVREDTVEAAMSLLTSCVCGNGP